MEEQKSGQTILSEEDRSVIAKAVDSPKFKSSPVSPELLDSFNDDLASFVSIPYTSKSRLSSLYGPGLDVMPLLCADWKEAYAQGALYMRDAKTVSFATHLETANGSAVELSITENAQDGLPWFLSYVPIADRIKLRRDIGAKTPSVDTHVHPVTATNTDTDVQPAEASLPPLLERNLERMQETEDYLDGVVPQDLIEEFSSLGEELSSFAWTSQRWTDTITEYAKHDIDVTALLDRDWKFAFCNRIIRFYEGKVIFPISVLRNDGETPVEVSITRDRKMDRPGALPWRVCYVDNFAFQKVRAGRALTD